MLEQDPTRGAAGGEVRLVQSRPYATRGYQSVFGVGRRQTLDEALQLRDAGRTVRVVDLFGGGDTDVGGGIMGVGELQPVELTVDPANLTACGCQTSSSKTGTTHERYAGLFWDLLDHEAHGAAVLRCWDRRVASLDAGHNRPRKREGEMCARFFA